MRKARKSALAALLAAVLLLCALPSLAADDPLMISSPGKSPLEGILASGVLSNEAPGGEDPVVLTHTVAFYRNFTQDDGTVYSSGEEYASGEAYSVYDRGGEGWARADLRFIGWTTDAAGETPYVTDFTMGDADISLYAQWAQLYSVTYHYDGADGAETIVDTAWYAEGEAFTPKTAAEVGWADADEVRFAFWTVDAQGETRYKATEMGTANLDLYGLWDHKYLFTIRHLLEGSDPEVEVAETQTQWLWPFDRYYYWPAAFDEIPEPYLAKYATISTDDRGNHWSFGDGLMLATDLTVTIYYNEVTPEVDEEEQAVQVKVTTGTGGSSQPLTLYSDQVASSWSVALYNIPEEDIPLSGSGSRNVGLCCE